MQEIQAIQASPPLATTKENTTHKSALSTHTESPTDGSAYQDDSIKVTLSSRVEGHKEIKDIKDEQPVHETKKTENHEIDYSLAMSGIPQFGGRLVTLVKYPDGRTEMIDAFSGKEVTQEELQQAQMQQESSEATEQAEVQQVQIATPGESTPTDSE